MVTSAFCMFAILFFLSLTHSVLQARSSSSDDAIGFWSRFPISIHHAWIMVATAANVNIVLVFQDAPAHVQYASAVASVLVLLGLAWQDLLRAAASNSVSVAADAYVFPIVLTWALTGIYAELSTFPTDPKLAARFTISQIQSIRFAAALGASHLGICIVTKLGLSMMSAPTSSSSETKPTTTTAV